MTGKGRLRDMERKRRGGKKEREQTEEETLRSERG
jgi:hypothetical protein